MDNNIETSAGPRPEKEKQINLSEKDLVTLKSLAYDFLMAREKLQRDLNAILSEIDKREQK